MDDLDFGATIKGFSPDQKVLNRYKLIRILGRGGMGVVWLARDEELERDVALKFLPEVVAADRVAIEEMKREVRRAIDLAHPHIVKIHDFVTDGRVAAVSMEHITGGTLSSLRIDQPGQVFQPDDLAGWIGQLCGALDYAHQEAEVVHRDLKPANLMVDAKGRLRILDFGIAASISESVTRVSKQAGSSGTPVYMSPQQMMGEDPAVTDDVYALGATIYELLTGKPPFHAGNILLQVQNKVAPLLNERRKTLGHAPVPGEWEQAIAACLAKEAKDRPQSAGELAQRLGVGAPGNRKTLPTPGAKATPATIPTPATAPTTATTVASGPVPSNAAYYVWKPALWALAISFVVVGLGGLIIGTDSSNDSIPIGEKLGLTMLVGCVSTFCLWLLLMLVRLAVTKPKMPEAAAPASRPEVKPGKTKWLRRVGLVVALVMALVAINYTVIALRRSAGGQEAKLESLTIPELNLVMRPIPTGSFRLGTPAGGEADERPLTDVTFTKPFWLGQTEVTQRQWQQVMGWNRSAVTGDDLPATNFTWYAAMEFSRKLTERERAAGRLPAGYVYSLPTERQWEYAARAGSAADREPDLGAVAWYVANSVGKLHPVGQKRANAWGLQDMLGNALEMCLDEQGAYPGGKQTDPVTEIKGDNIVMRGGCFQNDAGRCRVASRYGIPAVIDPVYAGMRLALIPENSRIDRRPPPPPPPVMGKAYSVPLYDIALVPIVPATFSMVVDREMGPINNSREVTLTRPFWLGKTEVTQRQWQEVMGSNPANFKGDDRPVENVSWTEAMEFCRKLTELERGAGRLPEGYTYTLPTEAEWVCSYQAGIDHSYAGGDLDETTWYLENSGKTTHPVAQKKANAWGLTDMAGNVSEWCSDWFGDLSNAKATDPIGPPTGAYRIRLGGSWNTGYHECLYWHRNALLPDLRNEYTGFRVALAPAR